MTNNLSKWFALFFLATSASFYLYGQAIISEDEIDAALKEIGTVTVTDNGSSPIIQTTKNGKKTKSNGNGNRPILTSSQPEIPVSYDLISYDDSLSIRRQAIMEAMYNPIFLDWVFQKKSMPHVQNDSLSVYVNDIRDGAKSYIRANEPELFTFHQDDLPKVEDIILAKSNRKKSTLALDSVTVKSAPIKIDIPKPSNWKYGARFQVQATQNYISPNWYKGGESNLALLTLVDGNLNYNDNKYVQWDNTLEWKFGLNSAGSDSLRMFRTNDDLFRVTSKLGIKAVQNWYYTAQAELNTQFFNTYTPNTWERVGGAFSPIRFYGSVGMDYKYKNELSVFISPISYKMIFVADTTRRAGVAQNIADKVGIDAGKNIKHELGSMIKVQYAHKFNDEINIETRMSLFTNYTGIEFDWEVIGNFIINRFMSARVSLNPRYDSTVKTADGSKPKLQFKELISLGFQYKL